MAKKKRARNSPVALQRTTEEIEDASQQFADEISHEATEEALQETISQMPSHEAIEEATEEAPQGSISHEPPEFVRRAETKLPELSEEAGHTLVHYLYTGTYQTPQSQDSDEKITELRRDVCLYCTAIKYGLAGLATLAREKIQNIKGEVAVFDTLGIIKEAYQTMLGDDAGLTPYMKGEIKTAFEIDPGLFEKDTFVELFGEAKQFDRILMRIVAELFAEKMAAIYENTQLTINGSANEAIVPENSTRLSQHETLREELEATIIEESAVEYAECEVPTEAPEEYAVENAECEAPTQAPEEYAVEYAECEVSTEVPEEYTMGYVECEVPAEAPDEYTVGYAVYEVLSSSEEAAADAVCEKRAPFSWNDYGDSWEVAAHSKEPTSVFCEEAVVAEEPTSVFCEETAAAEEATSVLCEETAAAEEATSVLCEETAAAEEATSVLCEETAAAEEPTSVLCEDTPAEKPTSVADTEPISIHSKEPTSIAIAELAPIPDAKLTAVPDEEPAPLTKVSRERMKLRNGKVIALPENEQNQTEVDRKKRKTLKRTFKVASYQPEKNIHKKKAKKANKEKSSEISESSEPDSGSGRVPEPVHETIPEPSSPWLILKPSKHATQESSVCASQAEHLLNGNMWKNCNKCRALTTTAAEEGFEVVEATN